MLGPAKPRLPFHRQGCNILKCSTLKRIDPGLIRRYLRAPAHDAVIGGYLGHLDVLVTWPFAKLRGVPVIWGASLSKFNTVVEDRRMLTPSPRLVAFAWERLACRAVRTVVPDSRAAPGNQILGFWQSTPTRWWQSSGLREGILLAT